MKIIDLLNKIANGEEVPKKIKVLSANEIFTYDNAEDDYISELNFVKLFRECIPDVIHLLIYLNDEVEIIEEEKKIPEKLENLYKIEKGLTLDGVIAWQGANNKILGNKIDEIIDYLNSKGE